MPIRAVVSPKFTYGQGYNYLQIVRTATSTDASKNGMFDYSARTPVELEQNCIMPPIAFPAIGNGHSARKSNRITVSSIRVKMTFQMNGEFLLRFHWLATQSYQIGQYTKVPLNPTMFLKCRLFLISVDDDIEMTREKLFNWFYSTHCLYRYPTVDEVLNGPSVSTITTAPGPTSVHSSVLRTTTDWTGKFNVLADRKFTIRPTKPQFDIDMTIPLRKEYVFDEKYDETSELLYPKLYLFILPPLSYEVDVDPYTAAYAKSTAADQTFNPICFYVYSWCKLNFVDL